METLIPGGFTSWHPLVGLQAGKGMSKLYSRSQGQVSIQSALNTGTLQRSKAEDKARDILGAGQLLI